MAQVKQLMLRAQHPTEGIADVEVSVRNVKKRRRDFENRGYSVDVYAEWTEVVVKPVPRKERAVQEIGPWRVKRWWVPWIVFLVLMAVPIGLLWAMVSSSMNNG